MTGRHGTVIAVCAAVVVGLLGSGALVWQRTATVGASTANGTNSWTLGAVTIKDDDSGGALFSGSGLLPSATGANCITVTYTGTVATSVTLYASASSDPDGVEQYVDLTIQQGSGGGFGSCGSFVPASTIYSGTLADFAADKVDHASGVGSWSPEGPAGTVYRIAYTLDAATPNSKQGASTSATFQWEARS